MTNKQLKAKYSKWISTPHRYVNDVYGSPSTAKIAAERKIYKYMMDNDGYGYRVMSHNRSFFTVGYIIHNENGKCFVYETAYNQYVLQLDD